MGLQESRGQGDHSGFIRIHKRNNRHIQYREVINRLQDPEVHIDRQQLNRCLQALESFSGE